MHTLSTTFVLGYHGCDAEVAERVLGGEDFKPSQNDYDWLGHGICFWEANPLRGLDFARELTIAPRGRSPGRIRSPAVVGAVIDLGLCLDLTTRAGVQQVRDAHRLYLETVQRADWKLPKNSRDGLRRNLDCAVINYLHLLREGNRQPAVESVKGVFLEGDPIYDGAGFYEKTHIQICVCSQECIKGVFRVPKRHLA